MITLKSLNKMKEKPNPPAKKPQATKVVKERMAAQRKPLVSRLKRIRALLSRGQKITIIRLVNVEGISRQTASKDLHTLFLEGFAKFIMVPDETNNGRVTTKLYSKA